MISKGLYFSSKIAKNKGDRDFKDWERYRLSFGISLGHLDRGFYNIRLSLG